MSFLKYNNQLITYGGKFLSIPNDIIKDRLVLHLDADNPSSYPGTGINWYDLSGYNNHMSSIGNIENTFKSNGYFETTGVNGVYWRNGSLHKTFNNEDLTLSVWCNNDVGADLDMIWCWKNGQPGPDLFSYMNKLNLNIWDGNGNPFSGYNLSSDGWYGNWNNVTVVWKYDVPISLLYINGVYIGTAGYRTPNSNQLNIGGSATPGYGWAGKFSSVLLYNKALSDYEILYNYNGIKSRYNL